MGIIFVNMERLFLAQLERTVVIGWTPEDIFIGSVNEPERFGLGSEAGIKLDCRCSTWQLSLIPASEPRPNRSGSFTLPIKIPSGVQMMTTVRSTQPGTIFPCLQRLCPLSVWRARTPGSIRMPASQNTGQVTCSIQRLRRKSR